MSFNTASLFKKVGDFGLSGSIQSLGQPGRLNFGLDPGKVVCHVCEIFIGEVFGDIFEH